MASTNEHTGASLVSKANTKEFDAGYDLIFGKSKIGSFADLLPAGNGKSKDEFTFYADVSFSSAPIPKEQCVGCGKETDDPLIKPGDIVTFGTKAEPLCNECGEVECECEK
jgi:hypothetical protein